MEFIKKKTVFWHFWNSAALHDAVGYSLNALREFILIKIALIQTAPHG